MQFILTRGRPIRTDELNNTADILLLSHRCSRTAFTFVGPNFGFGGRKDQTDWADKPYLIFSHVHVSNVQCNGIPWTFYAENSRVGRQGLGISYKGFIARQSFARKAVREFRAREILCSTFSGDRLSSRDFARATSLQRSLIGFRIFPGSEYDPLKCFTETILSLVTCRYFYTFHVVTYIHTSEVYGRFLSNANG